MSAVQQATGQAEAMLDAAAAVCARRGAKLTDLRRDVLRLVLEAGQPVGAYTLFNRLKVARAGAAPPTVYRSLDFLLDQGLIHKVERLNAFVACTEHTHDHPTLGETQPGDTHQHQFLICSRCGATAELTDAAVGAALTAAARARGFHPTRATVEIEGTCAACAAA